VLEPKNTFDDASVHCPLTSVTLASGKGGILIFLTRLVTIATRSKSNKEQLLKTLQTSWWVLSALACLSCLPSNELVQVESLAAERLGADVQTIRNAQAAMVLCLNATNREVRFLVYDLRSKEIIFEDTPGPAYVGWKSDSLIEVRYHTGIVSDPPQLAGYLYNVRTRSKIDIADFERRQRQ
jgi:hypothetical protein